MTRSRRRERVPGLQLTRAARALAAAASLLGAAALGGCRKATAMPVIAGGDAERGQASLGAMGCGSCHTIGGVTGAHGEVGPPLDGVARRSLLAGEVPNTPENMVRWIRDPQAFEPGTGMPNLHVDDRTARDMVAYLYTLR